MRALYLYFAETADPGRGPSAPCDDVRPVHEGPLVPIQPGAFSRWMANRDRVVAANAAALRGAGRSSMQRSGTGREGAR